MEDDLECFDEYLNLKFYFFENILLSDVKNTPNKDEFLELKKKMSKFQIEQHYNHFHMSFISWDIQKQMDFSIQIWKKWRTFFSEKMPSKNIVIQIDDYGKEVILYVFEIADGYTEILK